MSTETKAKKSVNLSGVTSSLIESMGYDDATKTLAVKFKKGSQLYHYEDFPAEKWAAFQKAESVGKHFLAHVKPHHVGKRS